MASDALHRVADVALRLRRGLLEFADRLAHPLCQFRQAFGAEQQEHQKQNQYELHRAEIQKRKWERKSDGNHGREGMLTGGCVKVETRIARGGPGRRRGRGGGSAARELSARSRARRGSAA